jgi:ribosomal protein S20
MSYANEALSEIERNKQKNKKVMSDIRTAIQQMTEPNKSVGEILMEFYDTMKQLEKDKEHGQGKQAVKIVMTMNDINYLIDNIINNRI